ncbi:class I SAM-dependent methyltransferase [Chloracidobacterium sp. D]|uniref:class I SAM-dependent methyltransferase n=1 Tax=Chloracidobacterium sp. D TaxID=2821536 RepID=UPI001B8DA5B5|nr:class I SAM-dependent methyltransferase [Chloracidobacterium sp. D]QUV80857.1 class I SAM-dependent methyltransferase [Chloracidobacterium sp. D]
MGKFADNYDNCMRPLERRFFEVRRRQLIPQAAGEVLEIGGGTGANLPFYGTAVTSLMFTDPDPAMLWIAAAKPRPPHLAVTFLEATAEALPFPAASFDTVVTTLVLCSVRDPMQALAEIRRVLRPGGCFLALEHVRPQGWLGYLADALTPLQKRLAAGCHLNRQTHRAIRQAGFSIRCEQFSILNILAEIEAVSDKTGDRTRSCRGGARLSSKPQMCD